MTFTLTDSNTSNVTWTGRAVVASDASMLHRRAVDVEATVSGGTVEGLIVPWDRATWVADDMPNGDQEIYREGFRRTAVDEQFFAVENLMRVNAPRVSFRHMHSRTDGFGPLGIGREFEVRDDGLWAAFHVISDRRATLAELVEGGISRLSVEFRAKKGGTVEDEDGTRWRTSVHLDGVALEWAGAYPEAQVLAMRAQVDDADRERGETEQVERERAEAEAAAAAEVAATLAAAEERARKQTAVVEWVAEQERLQAELAARYK